MAAMPKVSLRLHSGMRVQDCVDLAGVADEAGCFGLWFAENPFARGVMPAIAACVVATRRLQLGPGVLNPYVRHPAEMAMEIAALDEFSGGRIRLGIGAGVRAAIERMGLSYDRPLAAVRDAATIIRGLFAGDKVDYQGPVFAANGITLDVPVRSGLPIYLAGRGERMLQLCGELGDGLLISNMCAPGFAAYAAEAVCAAAAAVARSAPIEVVQYLPCSVRPDRAEAISTAKRAIAAMLPGYWGMAQSMPAAKEALLSGSGLDADDFARAASDLAAGRDPESLDDRFAGAFAIAGTAEDCWFQIAQAGTRGVSELALTIAGPSPAEDLRNLMRAAPAG